MTAARVEAATARAGRFDRYSAYRDSGVEWLGEIPSHWEVKPLKALLARNDGGAWGEDFSDDGVIVLRSTEQTAGGRWSINEPARRLLTSREASQSRLEVDDLVVTKSSGSELHIGKTSIVDVSVAALGCGFSNFMQRLRFRSGHLARFFWYLMNCPVAREQFVFLSSTTTGLGNLSGSILGAIRAPTAPGAEQRTIVAFLDHETARIDALVAKKERLIEMLREKRTALITRAVTKGLDASVSMKDSGIEWLGDIPAHWEVMPMGQAMQLVMDFRGRTPTKLGMGWGGDIPAVSAVSVHDGHIDLSRGVNYGSAELHDKWMTQGPTHAGDIVFTTEAPLGNVAMIPDSGQYILSQRVVLLRPRADRVNPRYLLKFLQASAFRQGVESRATGSTAEGIKRRYLMTMPVCVPPLDEQAMLSEHLSAEIARIDGMASATRNTVSLLQELRTALISAAVTGKIDVRAVAAP